MDLAQLRACIARFEEDCASLRTQLAVKDREIAALQGLLRVTLEALPQGVRLRARIEAALSAPPAPAIDDSGREEER